jgi:hypothetical protein
MFQETAARGRLFQRSQFVATAEDVREDDVLDVETAITDLTAKLRA